MKNIKLFLDPSGKWRGNEFPEEESKWPATMGTVEDYNDAVEQGKKDALEVINPDEVKDYLSNKIASDYALPGVLYQWDGAVKIIKQFWLSNNRWVDCTDNEYEAALNKRRVLRILRSPVPSDKYKFCNHHHELTSEHEVIDLGTGPFVANKQAIPLLKALNYLGLETRSHHIDEKDHAWVAIMLDNVSIEIRTVNEVDTTRTKYNGRKEILIQWNKDQSKSK